MRLNPHISKLWRGLIGDVSADDAPLAEELTEMAAGWEDRASLCRRNGLSKAQAVPVRRLFFFGKGRAKKGLVWAGVRAQWLAA